MLKVATRKVAGASGAVETRLPEAPFKETTETMSAAPILRMPLNSCLALRGLSLKAQNSKLNTSNNLPNRPRDCSLNRVRLQAQIAIEQYVTAHAEDPIARPATVP